LGAPTPDPTGVFVVMHAATPMVNNQAANRDNPLVSRDIATSDRIMSLQGSRTPAFRPATLAMIKPMLTSLSAVTPASANQ
jgi:hypothetical protein